MTSRSGLEVGRALCFFAFDFADEIDLAAVPSVLRPTLAPLVPRRPAPPYVAYAEPPVEIALGIVLAFWKGVG